MRDVGMIGFNPELTLTSVCEARTNLERVPLLLVGVQRGHPRHFPPLGAGQVLSLDQQDLPPMRLPGCILYLYTIVSPQTCI